MSTLGVVIVTYNSEDVIGTCLDSCAPARVVVVDNASVDRTCEEVRLRPHATLISNAENLGFAAAANRGISTLDTEYVLLLNPDVKMKTPPPAFTDLCTNRHPDIATGKLLDAAGNVQTGFNMRAFPTATALSFEVLGINRMLPHNAVNRRYRCLDIGFEHDHYVDQPPGAFILFRRDIWRRLGGFDEGFHPIWFEDVDFCKRAADLGYRAKYYPEVEAQHWGAHSISKLSWRCREVYWYASLLRYASKHFRASQFRGVSAAVLLSCVFRAPIGIMRWRSLASVSVYKHIFRLAMLSTLYGRLPAPDGYGCLSKVVG